MRLPTLLRPHLAFGPLQHLGDGYLLAMIARQLEQEGAKRVVIGADTVKFDSTNMVFNVSPLVTCRSGEVSLRRDAARTWIEYGLEVELSTAASLAVASAVAALCAWMIFQGRVAPVVIAALFYFGGLAGSYFFYSGTIADLVRRSVSSATAFPSGNGFGLAAVGARYSA